MFDIFTREGFLETLYFIPQFSGFVNSAFFGFYVNGVTPSDGIRPKASLVQRDSPQAKTEGLTRLRIHTQYAVKGRRDQDPALRSSAKGNGLRTVPHTADRNDT